MLNLGIRMIKLQNGELLIAGVTRLMTEYLLERPLAVIIVPQTNKKGEIIDTSVIFNDWIDFTIDTHLTIPTNSVITLATPDVTMVKDYQSAVKTQDMNRMQSEFNDLFTTLDERKMQDKSDEGVGIDGETGYNTPNELPLDDESDADGDDPEEGIQ